MSNEQKDLDGAMDLSRTDTSGTVNMPRDIFEKLYLQPKGNTRGHLAQMFANPTPFGLVGFLMVTTPLSVSLMGWRNAGSTGVSIVGWAYFFGGLMQIIACILEFVIGNTFPFVVFGTFGAFWLSYGATLTPDFAATATDFAPQFPGTYAFALLTLAFLVFLYMILAIRTNITFVLVFFTLDIALCLLSAAFFVEAQGEQQHSDYEDLFISLEVAAGAWAFVLCVVGWYLFMALMLPAVDFPFNLPIGDLSTRVPSATELRKKRQGHSNGV